MALWMNRAGRRGESEQTFLHDGRIYLQWTRTRPGSQLDCRKERAPRPATPDISRGPGRTDSTISADLDIRQDDEARRLGRDAQKTKLAVHFGEITGSIRIRPKREPLLRQYRSVNWFATDIPRSAIPQDILYSFVQQTICRIDDEERIRAMAKNGWKLEGIGVPRSDDRRRRSRRDRRARSAIDRLGGVSVTRLPH